MGASKYLYKLYSILDGTLIAEGTSAQLAGKGLFPDTNAVATSYNANKRSKNPVRYRMERVPYQPPRQPPKKQKSEGPVGRKQMLYVYSLFDAAGKLLGKGTARELIDAGLMANTRSVSYAYVHGGVNEKWGVARMTRRLEERVVEPKDAKDVQNRTPYRKTKLKGIPDPTPLQWDVHDLIVYNKLAEKAGKPELSYGFWAVKGKPERP